MGKAKYILIGCAVIIFGVLVYFIWMQTNKVKNMMEGYQVETYEPKKQKEDEVIVYGKVTKRIMWDPSRKFVLNRFFSGEVEIASYKQTGDEIFDKKGTIPDGRIEFVNDSTKTYGVEFYEDELRNGLYREYYKTGEMKYERDYLFGDLMIEKEFFIDGTPRMEVDFRDALVTSDDTEAGVGKVYFRDGSVMYEWKLTNSNPDKFKRSFNQIGQVTEIKKYDEMGILKSVVHPQKQSLLEGE